MTDANPATLLDHKDHGDDTQLRFRYQHGYGVILLCNAATRELSYTAIWCEHHEDLLGEKENGQFDSFQIKTKTPESGPWKLSSDEFVKSIGRFVEHDKNFPRKFDFHHFVSNVSCYETRQSSELAKSPTRFLRAVQGCDTYRDLPEVHARALLNLAKKIGCDKANLFETCKRVKIVNGPSLNDFEASIAHEHLPKLHKCSTLSPAELDALRDELIYMVYSASSLKIDNPAKHFYSVLDDDVMNPRLRAKRLVVHDTIEDAIERRTLVFRFAPSSTPLKLDGTNRNLGTLAQKLIRGGLTNQFETMQARTLSAERHLLALIAQDADKANAIINQIKQFVQGVCSDAEVQASANPEPWGKEMYRFVMQRLQNAADKQSDMVYRQPYECLMGMAGLLTENCTVWWSPRFNLEEAL